MYIYICFTNVTVSSRKNSTSFLHFSRNTDIGGPDGCLDTALKFLTAIFVYRKLSVSLCLIKKKKLDFRCFTIEDVKDTV